MNIHESAEDYLEAIYMLSMEKGFVRSIDVANSLGYSKPSVSVAMKQLEENGYVSRDADRMLHLEEKGLAIAQRIYERHETIAAVLMSLGVERETAYKDACKIEHDLSDESFRCIQEHIAAYGGRTSDPAAHKKAHSGQK